MSESPTPYRVLARKYRPQNFNELIGQDAMVTTLANAIRRGRLAHAFLLTGVRGVGKTSTARLIAKALNCIGADGQGGPTIDPCGVCEPCVAIAEGRHIDVVEMDAASHTSIDDVREIIEAVRYASVSARYKIYIIDEVHMLSKSAFNGLLKTLEEPPAHVKFLFATTEVNKVPITVLSRCQRFDLRRITADKLAAHFTNVVAAEGVEADPEALALIARAAEGSARDGLSILDQAIAHGSGRVEAQQVRDMLGLSDRGAVRRLFGELLKGDANAVLTSIRGQYDLGVEPVAMLHGLLEACHAVTRAKVAGTDDPALSAEEREAYGEWAGKLGFATLHRLWQLLLKGHGEVQTAAMPIEAAEMALLRVVHASQLPDPGELARRLASGDLGLPAAPAPQPAAETQHALMAAPAPVAVQAAPVAAPVAVETVSVAVQAPPPAVVAMPAPEAEPAVPPLPASGAEIHELLLSENALLAQLFHDYAAIVRLEGADLLISRHQRLPQGFVGDVANILKRRTGRTWSVGLTDEAGEPSLLARIRAEEDAARVAILESPLVKAALEAFPEAELVEYSVPERRSLAS
ncbi:MULTISPECIES: DNA polymerase III subunit gamma/tau [unclassified Sphingomonas]|uniref:DNA polymerase III subunit gamma/tau n=1 Tax=unclassified Sphingomonas TaxID=196159 RepID=UPI0006F87471|nr:MULTISPECIES: DNA polymerase III subunit gamma/tau [unclassified Sphingomonas]KQX20204.1 DNA polymerase III subunit gamma/tau [Sphingomonas sp. Root1294]KQY67454.1 DNA polymerase III subunit gamma/tau [Sphingomonas sp. Root50]KRB90831.1 DNA polymerase III subunit gamma/tau [Sphingomonas sp. Root720]